MADSVVLEVVQVLVGALFGGGVVANHHRRRAHRNGGNGSAPHRPAYELAVEPGWRSTVDRDLGSLSATVTALDKKVDAGFAQTNAGLEGIRKDLAELWKGGQAS